MNQVDLLGLISLSAILWHFCTVGMKGAWHVYNETASLRPKEGDPHSSEKLCEARRRIAGIAQRDPDRVADIRLMPELHVRSGRASWAGSLYASWFPIAPGETDHFIIWPGKEGEDGSVVPDESAQGRERLDDWPFEEQDKISHVYGPFYNAYRERDEYVFFYTGVP